MRTRTGDFRIGFRRGGSSWQRNLAGQAAWAKGAGFELIDLGQVTGESVQTVQQAGLEVVSVDLHDWSGLLNPDSAKRKDAIARNTAYIEEMAALGVKIFFTVAIPADADRSGKENFNLAVASYAELASVAEKHQAQVVLEGWPGGPPFPNLFCNPESCRALFREVISPGIGLNFDPSHLIRMGIDPVRFIDEFAGRVGHVHGKDTEILTDGLYEVGLYQASIFQKPVFCGEFAWRYTIPGDGVTRWAYVFSVLKQADFSGAVSVELEDARYTGTQQAEQDGLVAAMNYLTRQ